MKFAIVLALSLCALAQTNIIPSQVTVDAASEAALVQWMGTQHGAKGSELVSGVDANGVKLQVKIASNFSNAVSIIIDSEQMDVKSINGTEITVTRGFNGTAKAVHSAGAPVYIMRFRTVSDLARMVIIDNFRRIIESVEVENAAVAAAVAAKAKSSNGVR